MKAKYRFTAHVPEGMKPCKTCCDMRSDERIPGEIHEWPEDAPSYPITQCVCLGTGLELPQVWVEKHKETHREWHESRRTLLDRRHELQKEFIRGELLLNGEIWGRIKRAQELLALSGPIPQEQFQDICFPAYMLAWFLEMTDAEDIGNRLDEIHWRMHNIGLLQGQEERGREYAEYREKLTKELAELSERVRAMLPEPGSKEEARMRELTAPIHYNLKREYALVCKRLEQPLLIEEILLILSIHDMWVRVGRPAGTYGQEVKEKYSPNLFKTPSQKELEPYVGMVFPKEIKQAAPELLAIVRRTALRHGDVEKRPLCFLRFSYPHEITFCVPLVEGNFSIIVHDMNGLEDAYKIRRDSKDGTTTVTWGKTVSVAHVRECLEVLDKELFKNMLESFCGERFENQKTSVEQVFHDPRTTVPVLPGGPDAETLRQQFDHPELLAVYSELGIQSICLVSSLPLIKKRARLAKEILKGHGIATESQVQGLSWERILELRAEIDQKMQAYLD